MHATKQGNLFRPGATQKDTVLIPCGHVLCKACGENGRVPHVSSRRQREESSVLVPVVRTVDGSLMMLIATLHNLITICCMMHGYVFVINYFVHVYTNIPVCLCYLKPLHQLQLNHLSAWINKMALPPCRTSFATACRVATVRLGRVCTHACMVKAADTGDQVCAESLSYTACSGWQWVNQGSPRDSAPMTESWTWVD